MTETCVASGYEPLQDLDNYFRRLRPDEVLFWYIGKASVGLKEDGGCRKNQRSIDSFREHLPVGQNHKTRRTYHKVLTDAPIRSFSYFYANKSERDHFVWITNAINNAKIINLNINMCNGTSDDNCYVHLYVCSRNGSYRLHCD